MTSYYLDVAGGRRSLRLSSLIAEGAAGTVHRVIGEPGIVVKLYKYQKDLAEYRDKIAAMLATPPDLAAFSHQGRSYVQIAWPTGTVSNDRGTFAGFVMPEVDLTAATELENILQKSSRKRKQLPDFYGARVLLAANLATLTAELHALGHYMVDVKPINMRFYPHAWYMAILDTDGFSINGPRRFPARQWSLDYIAPEAIGAGPENTGLAQDLFALAVIAFQLLNNGVHPYQGIDPSNSTHPTSLQERISAHLYAYGRSAASAVGPSVASIHEYFEQSTRELFDRAFLSGANRPTAAEWRDHLRSLINNRVLVKCAVNPNEHAHFSRGCGFCALERRIASRQTGGTVLGSLPVAGKTQKKPRAAAKPRAPSPRFVRPSQQALRAAVPIRPRGVTITPATTPKLRPRAAQVLVMALLATAALFAVLVWASASRGPENNSAVVVRSTPPTSVQSARVPALPSGGTTSATVPVAPLDTGSSRTATPPVQTSGQGTVAESDSGPIIPTGQSPSPGSTSRLCIPFNGRMECE